MKLINEVGLVCQKVFRETLKMAVDSVRAISCSFLTVLGIVIGVMTDLDRRSLRVCVKTSSR